MYVVFIIPRLIEKEGSGEGHRDAVVWNGRERDVLEYFAARYRSWLRRAAQRYVSHEIARIAGDPVAESGRLRFSSPSRGLRSIYQSGKRGAMASGASDRDARYSLLASVLENATGIFFPFVGRGV